MRFGAVAIAAVAVVLLVSLVFVACSGSSDKKAAGTSARTETKKKDEFKQQELKVGTVKVESIGPLGTIPKDKQKVFFGGGIGNTGRGKNREY